LNRRSKQRGNNFFKNGLRWLKRLWKSLIKSLRIFFTADVNENPSDRSPQYEEFNAQYHQDRTPQILTSLPKPFLLGLENIDNLEFLTTKELIEQIEWNAESQEILTAKEEDLTLLEDLLVNFPET
jgi:hypothetical protein